MGSYDQFGNQHFPEPDYGKIERSDNSKPKKNYFKETFKLLIGIGMLLALGFFVGSKIFKIKTAGAGIPDSNIIKTSTYEIQVYPWHFGGITYLVFKYNSAINVVNYTADSLRLLEYRDFQASVADSAESK